MAFHKDSFIHLAQYNAQANRHIFEACALLTSQARNRDAGSYFGSIMGILNHTIVADYFWLNRFKPVLPESKVLGDPRITPENLSWTHPLHGDFTEMRKDRGFVDGRILAWIEECPEPLYSRTFDYVNSAGETKNAIVGRALNFLFQHQTHHRAQISQILDATGLPNNPLDLDAFMSAGE